MIWGGKISNIPTSQITTLQLPPNFASIISANEESRYYDSDFAEMHSYPAFVDLIQEGSQPLSPSNLQYFTEPPLASNVDFSSIADESTRSGQFIYSALLSRIIPTFGLLSLLGVVGCIAHQNQPATVPPIPTDTWIQSQENRRVRTDLVGDSQLGTVIFVRQAHFRGSSQSSEIVNLVLGHLVGQYQMEMLRFLEEIYNREEMDVRHLFRENQICDYSPGPTSDDQGCNERISRDIQRSSLQSTRLLSGSIPTNPTDMEYIAVSFAGAALVHILRHNDVYMHRTLLPEEYGIVEECSQVQQRHSNSDEGATRIQIPDPQSGYIIDVRLPAENNHPEVREICHNRRDRLLVREISNFLREHPGASVVVVYGAGHEISDYFIEANFEPRIFSVWWEISGIPIASFLRDSTD